MNTSSQKPEESSKEIIFQIYLPLGLFVLVFLFLCVLVAVGSSIETSQVHHWANISVLFISIPVIILSFIFIIILAALIYGQAKLIRWLPLQIKKIYLFVLKVSLWIWNFSQKITLPPIKLKSGIYGIKHGLRLKQDIKD
jgi:heme/copper-type cytochrome/quinol oxidase subunit 2